MYHLSTICNIPGWKLVFCKWKILRKTGMKHPLGSRTHGVADQNHGIDIVQVDSSNGLGHLGHGMSHRNGNIKGIQKGIFKWTIKVRTPLVQFGLKKWGYFFTCLFCLSICNWGPHLVTSCTPIWYTKQNRIIFFLLVSYVYSRIPGDSFFCARARGVQDMV